VSGALVAVTLVGPVIICWRLQLSYVSIYYCTSGLRSLNVFTPTPLLLWLNIAYSAPTPALTPKWII